VTHHGDDVALTVETAPDARDVEALGQGLTEHALPFTHRAGFEPLAVFARDRNGVLVGGVHGHVNWTWLHVALFWIAAGERRRGLGSSLLRTIETAAIERGCTQAHLDTFSYQARPFYERHGYALFATLEDYPPGHQRFFLRKVLRVADPVSRVARLARTRVSCGGPPGPGGAAEADGSISGSLHREEQR
jgi:GNAT superfamily N-acetyltransferase